MKAIHPQLTRIAPIIETYRLGDVPFSPNQDHWLRFQLISLSYLAPIGWLEIETIREGDSHLMLNTLSRTRGTSEYVYLVEGRWRFLRSGNRFSLREWRCEAKLAQASSGQVFPLTRRTVCRRPTISTIDYRRFLEWEKWRYESTKLHQAIRARGKRSCVVAGWKQRSIGAPGQGSERVDHHDGSTEHRYNRSLPIVLWRTCSWNAARPHAQS